MLKEKMLWMKDSGNIGDEIRQCRDCLLYTSILRKAAVTAVRDENGKAIASIKTEGGEEELSVDAILVATGRRPNLAELHPERAGIELTQRGAVKTDEGLRTSVPHIWAMGDVAGGLQFTYISLDDSRIVKSQILGDGSRTTANRGAVPYLSLIHI